MLRYSSLTWIVISLASLAHAGDFSSPFSSGTCPEFDVANAVMADPNQYFSGEGTSKQCLKACSTAAKACAAFVKNVDVCEKKFNDVYFDLQEQQCRVNSTSAEAKSCVAELKGMRKDSAAGLGEARATAMTHCNDWGQTCGQGCVP